MMRKEQKDGDPGKQQQRLKEEHDSSGSHWSNGVVVSKGVTAIYTSYAVTKWEKEVFHVTTLKTSEGVLYVY